MRLWRMHGASACLQSLPPPGFSHLSDIPVRDSRTEHLQRAALQGDTNVPVSMGSHKWHLTAICMQLLTMSL
jgi:hypothetical protein